MNKTEALEKIEELFVEQAGHDEFESIQLEVITQIIYDQHDKIDKVIKEVTD